MIKNELLRQQRLKRNWRLIDVAERVGVTVITVQRWERGVQRPGLYYRARLCTLFGLSADELALGETSLPLLDGVSVPLAVDASGDGALWTVPYMRNAYFMGRDDLLARIEQGFVSPVAGQATSIRSLALTGLSGIGKTQVAVEYAYRMHERQPSTHILWITAASEGTILASFAAIANLIATEPIQHEVQLDELIASVLGWLEQRREPWLLIMDNADDLDLVQTYLPHRGKGHLLFTTQASSVGLLATPIEVDSMDVEDGTRFLLHRARRLDNVSSDDVVVARQIVVVLAQFPLALDQAGAYIEETGCTIARYLQLYQDHRQTLLTRRGNSFANHPNPVATTWSFSFRWVEERNPMAAQLLRLFALLSPQTIPEEFIIEGAAYWPAALQQAINDPLAYDQMFQDLLAFSLVKRLASNRITNQMVSVHHLVQTIQIDQMSADERYDWAQRVVRAVHTLFPLSLVDVVARSHCLRYLGQVEAYHTLMERECVESAELLAWAGSCLVAYELYHIAEPLLQSALHMREQQVGLLHPDTLQCLIELAFLYTEQERYAEAHLLYDHLLHVCISTISGCDNPDMVEMQTYINTIFMQANLTLTPERQKKLTHFLAGFPAYTFQTQPDFALTGDAPYVVRELRAQGTSIREISRRIGLARNTVRRYLRADPQSVHRGPRRESVLDPYKAQIRIWMTENSPYTSQDMFKRLQLWGYTGSLSTLKAFVHELRQEATRSDTSSPPPLSGRERQAWQVYNEI